jgi:outer membrane immunogenic protein
MSLLSTSAKVLTASLVLASVTSLAFAKGYKGETAYKDVPCPPPVMLKDGWYLGAQVGYDSYRVREIISTPATSDLAANPVMNATGWVGGLYLGYGQYLTNLFYLAGEIFGNVSSADVNTTYGTNIGHYNNQFQVNSSYGFSVIPGLRLNNTSLGYLKLGWNWANMKAKESIVAGSSTSKSNTSNGFNLGIGIETLLVDNWSVRTEFDHTFYNSFSTGNGFGTSFKPSDNQFTVGVSYHFA